MHESNKNSQAMITSVYIWAQLTSWVNPIKSHPRHECNTNLIFSMYVWAQLTCWVNPSHIHNTQGTQVQQSNDHQCVRMSTTYKLSESKKHPQCVIRIDNDHLCICMSTTYKLSESKSCSHPRYTQDMSVISNDHQLYSCLAFHLDSLRL